MKTLEQENTVVADALAPRSIEDIKSSYPDEWVVLGNAVMDEYEQSVLSGIVLYHSPNKRELAYRDKPLQAQRLT